MELLKITFLDLQDGYWQALDDFRKHLRHCTGARDSRNKLNAPRVSSIAHTIISHRYVSDNLLEYCLPLGELLVLSLCGILKLGFELLNFSPREEFCVVAARGHRAKVVVGFELGLR